MELVYIVILIALIEYIVMAMFVGRARGKFKIDAPATFGHPEFDRWFRVHQNTEEQLIIVIPAMVLFGLYLDARWAAGFGLAFVLARILYARDYLADPKGRGKGFLIGFLATAALVLGALWGVGRTFF